MSDLTAPSAGHRLRRWFAFDGSRLRWPEWAVGISTLVLLVSLVGLSWFSFMRASGGAGPKDYVGLSEDGWNGLSHAHWLLLLTILVGFALFFLQGNRRAPAGPVALSLTVMVLGALSTIWLLVRVVIDPPGGRQFGGWLGLVSSAVLAWAGYRSLRMEGIASRDGPRDIPTVGLEELGQQETSSGAEPTKHS